jgi:hypothetical protein
VSEMNRGGAAVLGIGDSRVYWWCVFVRNSTVANHKCFGVLVHQRHQGCGV